MPYEYDPDALLEAEADIRSRLEGQPVDLEVQRAISNLYRAATVVSRTAEREVLADRSLSWSAFTALFVLWVWGEMDSSRLAAEIGLTPGTLTGVRKGLEAQDLVATARDTVDGRRVLISLTASGEELIEDLYPRFDGWATRILDTLSRRQVNDLADLLQHVIVRPSIDVTRS